MKKNQEGSTDISSAYKKRATEDLENTKLVIDYPPPYLSGTFHLGHFYEGCLLYPYLKALNFYKTLNQGKRSQKLLSLEPFGALFPNFTASVNYGLDSNGLPIALKVLKEKPALKEDQLLKECKKYVNRTAQTANSFFNKIGFTKLPANFYITNEPFFKQKAKQVLQILKDRALLKLKRMVYRFCPKCKTFISNVETDYKVEQGTRYYFNVYDSQNRPYSIMTTKPEFLVGSAFICYNPKDDRYKHLKEQVLSFKLKKEFKLKIYESNRVNPKVGTGLVIVCKWASLLDYEICRDLNLLEESTIYDNNGLLKKQIKAEYEINELSDLWKTDLLKNLVKKTQPTQTKTLRHTERSSCNAEIRFVTSKQLVIDLLKEKESFTNFVNSKISFEDSSISTGPSTLLSICLAQIKKLDYWCISRTEPYYSFKLKKNGRAYPLDTWFLSSLTQFYGPNEDRYLVRIQGSQIIRTWLIFSFFIGYINYTYKNGQGALSKPWALKFKEAREKNTNEVLPYNPGFINKALIHRLVLDPQGQKMSKSRNNGVEPDTLMKKYPLKFLRLYFCSKPLDKDLYFNEKQLIDIIKLFKKKLNLKLKINLINESIKNTKENKFNLNRQDFKSSTKTILEKISNISNYFKIDSSVHKHTLIVNSFKGTLNRTNLAPQISNLRVCRTVFNSETITLASLIRLTLFKALLEGSDSTEFEISNDRTGKAFYSLINLLTDTFINLIQFTKTDLLNLRFSRILANLKAFYYQLSKIVNKEIVPLNFTELEGKAQEPKNLIILKRFELIFDLTARILNFYDYFYEALFS